MPRKRTGRSLADSSGPGIGIEVDCRRWQATAGTAASAASGKTKERLAWITVGALATALIVTAIWWRNAKPPEQTMYFSASMPFPTHDIAFSPNRRTLAVIAYQESVRKNAIWI